MYKEELNLQLKLVVWKVIDWLTDPLTDWLISFYLFPTYAAQAAVVSGSTNTQVGPKNKPLPNDKKLY